MSHFLSETEVTKAFKLRCQIYICPNEQKPIVGVDNDDKVICSCGKPNPNAPESIQRIEKRSHTHVVKFLNKP